MADLAIVALGLDATGMKAGEAQAVRSLQNVEREMEKAEKQGAQLSKELDTSFQKVGKSAVVLGVAAAAAAKAIVSVAFEGSKLATTMLESSIKTAKTVDQMQQLKIGTTDLTPRLRELGGVMDFALVKSSALATKEFVVLEKQMDTIKAKIASEMAPGLEAAGRAMQDALRNAEPEIRASARHISDALESVSPAFQKFLEFSARFTSFMTGGALAGVVKRALTPDQPLPIATGHTPGQIVGPRFGLGAETRDFFRSGVLVKLPTLTAGGGGGGGGARARDTSPNLPTSFDPIVSRGVQHAFDLINAMNDANAAAAKAARELPVVIDTIADIFHRLGLPTFAGAAGPPIAAGGIPGDVFGAPLRPDQILGPRNERQARIEDALGGVFEDFVFQITSARSTISDAFKGLLLGITDTFAAEFAKAFQESLHNAFIKPLASWLEDALSSIFDGISGKGVGKFFKTLGSAFAGAFAEGGTIPAGHWGMVGERGPEIAYAGSGPMQIAPIGGGGGISINMTFAISTPTGEVSARTQDQIADSAMRGLERAQRLRGAR